MGLWSNGRTPPSQELFMLLYALKPAGGFEKGGDSGFNSQQVHMELLEKVPSKKEGNF